MKEMKENIFMFDVEATSLHGVGFAVGAVVADKKTGGAYNHSVVFVDMDKGDNDLINIYTDETCARLRY